MEVRRGEFVALVGRNGSGKSSLLRAIAGYSERVRGRIYAGDIRIDGLPAHRRSEYVALVEQDVGVGLPIHMSIGEVLELWTERRRRLLSVPHWGRLNAGLGKLLETYLPTFIGRLDDQVLTLSGGERQLLSLACLKTRLTSLGCAGFAVLLDEHTASLDSVLADRVMGESRLLVRAYHACGVVVTHQLQLAARFADRIVVLKDGRISNSLQLTVGDDAERRRMELEVQRLFREDLKTVSSKDVGQ